ncbi:MAG: glutamyl-tRNA synthetase [Chitinophagaceae bacterium]|nr:glutamyl-tRNA synthetase [Chitinophagaceae bacterium]
MQTMNKKVRVRFAPSPTGGLHLGGVRTVLYNYLFAKKQGGDFILRIEDTDQSRYVAGAEDYIFNCLKWIGLEPDESPLHGGAYGPYRQSERKTLYREYADQLVKQGHAYYAFDTPEELEKMRNEIPNFQYSQHYRTASGLRNSISLPANEVADLLDKAIPYVIRIKMPEDLVISFDDMIRGKVNFDSWQIDDKVLLKADGMPTYHLAVVVDDYLMKITHAFRGEEWLPSAPVHVLLWQYLFGLNEMPQWAHLPLILGPNGKLSKRDGAKYGFPVFAMSWADPKPGDPDSYRGTEGFKEKGFLPEAFINLLALLGWNDGTEQEIFTKEELIEKFSIERVHSSGAKFDYEKAKWFNHEWIKKLTVDSWSPNLSGTVKKLFIEKGIPITDESFFVKVLNIIKDRCTLLIDFVSQGSFFFQLPEQYDLEAVKPKWNEAKKIFFKSFIEELNAVPQWESAFIEDGFKKLAVLQNIKPGELQLPFRIMLVGGKFGPPVFEIAAVLGKEETILRIRYVLELI